MCGGSSWYGRSEQAGLEIQIGWVRWDFIGHEDGPGLILSWFCTVPLDTKEIRNGSRILHSGFLPTEMHTYKMFGPVERSAKDAGNKTTSRLSLM